MNTIKFDKGNTLVIAHRGLSGLEKENTNSAFVAAGNRSYYGIETDIHKTKDGHFVINHDGDFNRVAGENIVIEESTLEEIEKIILFDVDGVKSRHDLRPTVLQNYLSICKKYEKHSVLELKSNFTDGDIEKIIDIIKSYDYLDNVTFISFEYENLVRAHQAFPDLKIMLTCCRHDENVDRCLVDGFDIDMDIVGIKEETVNMFHDKGLKVGIWTANSKESMDFCISLNPDFIESDYFCGPVV